MVGKMRDNFRFKSINFILCDESDTQIRYSQEFSLNRLIDSAAKPNIMSNQIIIHTLRFTRLHLYSARVWCLREKVAKYKKKVQRENDSHDNEGHFNFIV